MTDNLAGVQVGEDFFSLDAGVQGPVIPRQRCGGSVQPLPLLGVVLRLDEPDRALLKVALRKLARDPLVPADSRLRFNALATRLEAPHVAPVR